MPKETAGANASPTSNYSPLLFPGEVTRQAELQDKKILCSHCLAWGREGSQLLKDKGLDLKSFHLHSRTPNSEQPFPHTQARCALGVPNLQCLDFAGFIFALQVAVLKWGALEQTAPCRAIRAPFNAIRAPLHLPLLLILILN